jgi:hypothetical protein
MRRVGKVLLECLEEIGMRCDAEFRRTARMFKSILHQGIDATTRGGDSELGMDEKSPPM